MTNLEKLFGTARAATRTIVDMAEWCGVYGTQTEKCADCPIYDGAPYCCTDVARLVAFLGSDAR